MVVLQSADVLQSDGTCHVVDVTDNVSYVLLVDWCCRAVHNTLNSLRYVASAGIPVTHYCIISLTAVWQSAFTCTAVSKW